VCFMINQKWCNDSSVLSTLCTPHIKTLTIKCGPYYMPREFSSLVLVAVYIPPWAHTPTAIGVLADHVISIENSFPDCQVLVLRDFNHTTLESELPKYKQVKCSIREGKTLDLCYSRVQ